MHRRGASRFCRNFLSHRTETKSFVKEPFCFPESFWYRKKFMDKRGHITISSRKFYVSQCQKISWASLKCFRKFMVSKNFRHTRGYHVFPSKIFCLSAENFCRGILYCCNNFGYRKSLDKGGGGGNHDFPSVLSHCIEIFHWRTLWCFRKILSSKIFMHRRGASRFCRKLFVSQCR